MKKLIFTFLFVMFFSGAVQAQIFKPSVNIIVRGNYSVWLSDSTWKNEFKAFPGVQLDAVVNLSSMWGIAGTFSADFINSKDRTSSLPGATIVQESSSQLAGYVGPRYYINFPGNKMVKAYIDAAAGIYSFKPGSVKETETTNPPRITTDHFNSFSQFGFNVGAGLNVGLGPKMFANFMVKYHNVLKKTDVVFTDRRTVEQQGTTTTTTTTFPPIDIDARSYFQFGIGLGFSFGM